MTERKGIADIRDVVEWLSIFADFVCVKKEPLPQDCVLRHWAGDVLYMYDIEEVHIPEQGVVTLDERKWNFCPGDNVPRVLLYSSGRIKDYPEKEIEDGIDDLVRYLQGAEQERVVV